MPPMCSLVHPARLNGPRCGVGGPIERPSDAHILCGRGNVNTKHPGNKKFARIVQESSKQYIAASSRLEKVIVVTSVVKTLRDSGMKFMMFDRSSKRCVDLPSGRVHGKVSHAIRDYIKQKEKVALRLRRDSLKLSKTGNQSDVPRSSCDLVQSSAHAVPKELDLHRNLSHDGNAMSLPTIHDTKKKGGGTPIRDQSSACAHKKKRVRMEPMPCPSGVPAAESPIAVPAGEASTRKQECGFELSRTIFDLGAKIDYVDSPLQHDIFSSLAMGAMLEAPDIFPLEEPRFSMAQSYIPSSMLPPPLSPPFASIVSIQAERMDGLTKEDTSPVHYPSSSAPLPLDSLTEFEEEDLKDLSDLLLDPAAQQVKVVISNK